MLVWWWLYVLVTPKQHLKLNSWKSWATLTLSWKNALLIKEGAYDYLLKVTSAKKFNFRKYSLDWRIFFILWKSYVLFSRYSMFCISNNSINSKVSDAMTSTCTWERVHFVTYLLYHKSLGHEPWATSRYNYGKYCWKMFWMIGKTGT